MADVERRARRRFDPVPAGHVGPQAGGRVQDRRTGLADRAAGNRRCVVRDALPRRRARSRGAADRNRQRSRRARAASREEGRSGPGERRARRGRELRSDQHAPRLASRRSVPADGGGRARRGAARSGAGAGAPRRRDRRADLRRPGQLDRLRDVLARRSRTFRTPVRPRAPSSSGRSRSASPPPCSAAGSAGSLSCCSRSWSGTCCS